MSQNLNWQRLKSKGWFGLSSEDVSDRSPYVRGTNDINVKPQTCGDADIIPPSRYSWAEGSKWEADKAYTKTSSEGWVYAIDFNAMKFNLRSGIYFTNSFLQVSLRLMGHYFYTIGILHHIE